MADQLPGFERQQQLEPTLLPQGISKATEGLAASDTLLGDMSAHAMQSASQERALQQGYEMGETPKGDLFPSITDFDKTVESAYKARSQSVLGLQAQQLLDSGQEAVASTNLSQAGIDAYGASSVSGIDSILTHAPSEVKQQLQSQYAQSLQNSIHQLNLKLITQNKAADASNYSAYSVSALQGIQDSAILGDQESSRAALTEYSKFNKQNLESGTINAKTHGANEYAAAVATTSGAAIAGALDARHNGKLDQYMAKFADLKNKPSGMSVSQWDATASNTSAYMKKVIGYKTAQDAQTDSEIKIKAQSGHFMGSVLSSMTSTMEPGAAKKTIFAVQKILAKNQQGANTTNQVLANKNNATALATFTPKNIDAAHAHLAQNYIDASQKQGAPISQDEAELKAGLDMATPVPGYVNRMNHGVLFGTADDTRRASIAKKVFASQNKAEQLNMSTEANAKLTNYDLLVDSGGMEPQEAFQKATELSNIDETMMKTRKAGWKAESNDNLSTSKSQLQKGRELTGLSNHWYGWGNTPLAQQDFMVRKALTLYKENYLLTGSLSAATKATTQAMEAKMSNTNINGLEEAAVNPITREMGLPDDGNQSIWADAKEKIGVSFKKMKDQYDRKELNYYYEIGPNAKDSSMFPDGSIDNNAPPVVVQKFRNGGESTFQLRIDSHQGEATMAGKNYNLSLQSNNATGLLFDLLPDAKNGLFIYSPDKDKIDNHYIAEERNRRSQSLQNQKVQGDSLFPGSVMNIFRHL